MNSITQQLTQMGFLVSTPANPVAKYVQTKKLNSTLFISGQLPIANGAMKYQGKACDAIDLEKCKEASQLCAFNLLSQLAHAIDDNPNAVESCIKIEIFINCKESFERLTEISDVASELIVKVLGDKGKHTRVTIGVPSLPLNATVEISGIFEIMEGK
jgi:enamine deaminase RidA (YjgF/YER057c/UK114 family)